MAHDNDTTKTSGTVSFKSVAQIYDGDDPSPEERRDLSDRAEDRIFHEVLAVPGRSSLRPVQEPRHQDSG